MPPQSARSPQSAAKWIAAILAISVHVAFVLFLVISVNWQNRRPEPVIAELYAPPTAAKVEAAKPPPEAPKPEAPKPEPPKPEPPKPEPPKPEPPKPHAEAPKRPPPAEQAKPDIALKEKQERIKQEQAERDRKQKEKQDADKRLQEKRLAEAHERQAREAEALQAQAERERQAEQKAAADAARAKADADYIRRIQAKIRGNVVLPPDMQGDPEAVFDVVQLPTGEIIDVQLSKSSGVRAYDEAVQRAIIKSSPLPRPASADMFRRSLTLKFRPLD
ncbi:MAG TPA: TonB C-terminal domain-containing protein [Casimicrobiaceae bacterium]|nr:TonB C-terminal domain-containing protein [Casimicrobiaceae bacterium]